MFVIIVLIFLSQLFNDPVSTETILSDNGMINAYGAIGAMRIGMGNQST
jgi:glucokinase